MKVLLFLATLAALAVFLSAFYHLIRKVRFGSLVSVDLPVTLIGISYLIFSVILGLWSFELYAFNKIDFLIIYSIVLIIQSISLIYTLFLSNKNPKAFYPFFAFLAVIPLSFVNISLLHLIVPVSLFIILLSFLTFSDTHQQTTSLLIGYCTVSLIGYALSLFWEGGIPFFIFASNLLLLFFMHSFFEHIRLNPRPFALPSIRKKESPIVHYLKHFVFIIIITNFIFVGTVGMHELGHLFMASGDTCEGTKITYELGNFPHTEINCSNFSAKNLWVLGGIILPLIMSILLFFGGGTFIKEIALQVLGFDMIFSYIDLTTIGLSQAIATFILFLGICLVVLSIAILAKSRTDYI